MKSANLYGAKKDDDKGVTAISNVAYECLEIVFALKDKMDK